ncbi:response regulator [Endothiovibrio diazotrophicus]
MSDNDDKPVVLVVDDTPANIDLIKGILQGRYKVKAATSGEKALTVAARAPGPDLILLDVMMPEMDGYEVCRRLKADPATAAIPVLFVTGHLDPAERDAGLALGALDYLSKPVVPERLLAGVAAALG